MVIGRIEHDITLRIHWIFIWIIKESYIKCTQNRWTILFQNINVYSSLRLFYQPTYTKNNERISLLLYVPSILYSLYSTTLFIFSLCVLSVLSLHTFCFYHLSSLSVLFLDMRLSNCRPPSWNHLIPILEGAKIIISILEGAKIILSISKRAKTIIIIQDEKMRSICVLSF